MHELSIVRSIVETAEEESRKHDALAVERIDLEIGDLSGVDVHALEFAWDVGVRNTVLEKACCEIHAVKGWARCTACNVEFEMKAFFNPCPSCGEYLVSILRGTEMKIKSITLLN